jgi:hypothetical protein
MFRLILCAVLLQGCSSAAVRCDAHLVPINAPTPKSAPADSSGAP